MASRHPPLWNVPYKQNRYFTGREETLRQLHRALNTVSAVGLTQAQGISGLGGIGKTQTAVEYAYRYGMEYDAVLWVRADSLTSLISSFLELARLLGLPERQARDQRIIVEAVLHWLRSHKRWLLIFDNIDDFALAVPFLPKASPGHMIYTTRARAFQEFGDRLEVLQMDLETGALLLLRRAELIPVRLLLSAATNGDRDLACRISRELDGLPLALDQAGAYIKETPSTLAAYLQLYQQRRKDLLKQRGAVSQDYPATVATTWSLSFEKVTQASPAATELLTLCAFLAPDAIPESIFLRGAPYLGDVLGPVAANEDQFNLACGEALRFSLIAREGDEETLSMHRLVQTVLRENTPVQNTQNGQLLPLATRKQKPVATRREWKQRAILAVNAASPDVQNVGEWPASDLWVPHALVCVNWIQQEKFFAQESTDLANIAGLYLDARARYQEAEHIQQNNLALYEQQFGPDHPYTGQSLVNLAEVYEHQGKSAAAEHLLQRALVIYERFTNQQPSAQIGLDNASLIYNSQTTREKNVEMRRSLVINELNLESILNNLARTCHSQGKYAEAEALYQRARAINQKHSGEKPSNEAQALSNLSTLYIEQGKYSEAEQLLKQALAIQQQLIGTMHPVTAEIFNNLGQFYAWQGKAREAEPWLKQALEIREKLLGSGHPDTAMSLGNLAEIYYEQGRYQEAEPLWEQALAIWSQHDHPDTVKCLNNLAELYRAQQKYAEAEPLLERAISVCERLSGSTHPDLAFPLNGLALLYMDMGKYEEGEPLLQRALAIREKALGTSHPSTMVVRKNLEIFYRNWEVIKQRRANELSVSTVASLTLQASQAEKQGNYAEAEALYRRALTLCEQKAGMDHLDTASCLVRLATCQHLQSNAERAEPLLQRALTIYELLLGARHLETATCLSHLAILSASQHKYARAESLWKRVLAIRDQQLGIDHRGTIPVLEHLTEVYNKQGKDAESEALLQRLLTLHELHFGSRHPATADCLDRLATFYQRQGRPGEAEPLLKRAQASRKR